MSVAAWERKLDLAEEHASEVIASLLREPLCQRFLQRSFGTGDNRVYTAEDVLGERIARVAALIVGERGSPGSVICSSRPGASKLKTILGIGSLALSAMPYLWTEEVRGALRSIELPRHVLSPKTLPTPRSWHTFETGIGLGGTLEYEGRTYIGNTADALLVADTGKGMECIQFGEMRDEETDEQFPVITNAHLPYGLTYPDDFEEESWRGLAQSVLTMFSFLNSPYIPKVQHRPSRAARREAHRLGKPLDEDYVTFVVLRRPEYRRHKSEDEQSVDWKHRWLVNGHVRAQWYPSEQAHRLIWIAPYLKGPEDAPMLNHAYKVAR